MQAHEKIATIQAREDGEVIQKKLKESLWAGQTHVWEEFPSSDDFDFQHFIYRVKPREFWINVYSKNIVPDRLCTHKSKSLANKFKGRTCLETIHVREVLKDEKDQ